RSSWTPALTIPRAVNSAQEGRRAGPPRAGPRDLDARGGIPFPDLPHGCAGRRRRIGARSNGNTTDLEVIGDRALRARVPSDLGCDRPADRMWRERTPRRRSDARRADAGGV